MASFHKKRHIPVWKSPKYRIEIDCIDWYTKLWEVVKNTKWQAVNAT